MQKSQLTQRLELNPVRCLHLLLGRFDLFTCGSAPRGPLALIYTAVLPREFDSVKDPYHPYLFLPCTVLPCTVCPNSTTVSCCRTRTEQGASCIDVPGWGVCIGPVHDV